MSFFNNRGQSLIEGLLICLLITFFMFAALQVCIMAVNDMYFNFTAFSSLRKAVVTKENKEILSNAKSIVTKLVAPYAVMSLGVIPNETTHWDEDILGKSGKDHNGKLIKKHNVKIAYTSQLMFYKLFGLFIPFRQQSARARMVKSPDAEYYDKAYPNGKEFKKFSVSF